MRPELPEAGSPQAVMLALIKRHLSLTPFEPFRVVTTSGRAYAVPTADHASVFPLMRQLTIADDSGGLVEIHTLHVSSIEKLTRRRGRSAKAA
ncbi:MAG: hypothetical protein WCQ89_11120 [Verrucomicrobiota bacterium]